jgi:hypothetical protein
VLCGDGYLAAISLMAHAENPAQAAGTSCFGRQMPCDKLSPDPKKRADMISIDPA